jgi:NAD(P)-dependent dehydrogenase (short-subunit alcohol dehydrogenase family)
MSVWFITGASRGFGIEITRQVLGRGDQVAATARHPEAITEAIPDAGDALLALPRSGRTSSTTPASSQLRRGSRTTPPPRARPANGRNRPTTPRLAIRLRLPR